jgi:hypothetical protein
MAETSVETKRQLNGNFDHEIKLFKKYFGFFSAHNESVDGPRYDSGADRVDRSCSFIVRRRQIFVAL